MRWQTYKGTLNTRSKSFDPLAKRAATIWNGQSQRCNNPRNKSYQTYGAMGIRVEYSCRDFVGWWLWQYKTKGHKMKLAGVGRIDHSKNYSFDNIEMVEHADNAREMYERTGGNKTVEKMSVVLVDEANEVTHVFSSGALAAKFAKVTPSYICLRKRIPGKKIMSFPFKVYGLNEFLKEMSL